jgi:CBS domain-containing protein
MLTGVPLSLFRRVRQVTAEGTPLPRFDAEPCKRGPVKVRELMTPDPAFCLPDTPIREVAGLMRQFDCGSIPVVGSKDKRNLVGIVTDRNIAIRAVAEGKGPDTRVEELMTVEPVTADPDDEMEIVRDVMINELVRRVPVTGAGGVLVGIIAQADLARQAADERELGEIVEAISEANSND